MMPLLFEQRQRWPQKYFFGWNLLREYNRVSVGKSAQAPHKVYPAPCWLKAFTARVDTFFIIMEILQIQSAVKRMKKVSFLGGKEHLCAAVGTSI